MNICPDPLRYMVLNLSPVSRFLTHFSFPVYRGTFPGTFHEPSLRTSCTVHPGTVAPPAHELSLYMVRSVLW